MEDTDKELYFVSKINEKDQSVEVESLLFGNTFVIKHDPGFYEFAKGTVNMESEEDEPLFFTVDFDINGKPMNYGKH